MVTVDQDTKEITMHVSDEELAKRKAETTLPPLYSRGVLGKYAHIVSSASRGAVTDSGIWNSLVNSNCKDDFVQREWDRNRQFVRRFRRPLRTVE